MNERHAAFEPVIQQGASHRAAFLNKVYNHLFVAIIALVATIVVFFQTGIAAKIAVIAMNTSWLLVLGGFMLAAWGFTAMVKPGSSIGKQYAGLAGYVVAEAALLSIPLYIAMNTVGPDVIKNAAIFTLVAFGGLSAIVYFTGKDFSFLRGLMMWGGLIALGLIVLGSLTGFHLGTWFTVGMIGYAGAAILYSTSNVLHHYPDNAYVGGALTLFAAVVLLFWYVLQFFMAMSSD